MRLITAFDELQTTLEVLLERVNDLNQSASKLQELQISELQTQIDSIFESCNETLHFYQILASQFESIQAVLGRSSSSTFKTSTIKKLTSTVETAEIVVSAISGLIGAVPVPQIAQQSYSEKPSYSEVQTSAMCLLSENDSADQVLEMVMDLGDAYKDHMEEKMKRRDDELDKDTDSDDSEVSSK